VNAILPGYIETEMNGPYWRSEAGTAFMRKFPRRRVGQPHELDELTLLLAGPGSAFMTGSIVLIDDGQSLMGY
jgi:NAD(P)-dependent dehydrogenase (short-subunit alcohol dehydrogenase family)